MKKLAPEIDDDPWDRMFQAIIADGWKYIQDSDGHQELYHVEVDPHELEDKAESERKRLREMANQVSLLIDEIPVADPSKRTRKDRASEDNAATKAALEALGYIDAEDEDGGDGEPDGDDESEEATDEAKKGKGRRRRRP